MKALALTTLALCSLAADLRVTQTVNVSKGIHCMIAKALLAAKAG